MSEKVKFTEEEVLKLKGLQDNFNTIVLQLGQVNIELIKTNDEIKRLQDLKNTLETDYKKIREQEILLGQELTKKYGNGIFDPVTGEFSPSPTN